MYDADSKHDPWQNGGHYVLLAHRASLNRFTWLGLSKGLDAHDSGASSLPYALVRGSSYLDVIDSHPDWLGLPFVEDDVATDESRTVALR